MLNYNSLMLKYPQCIVKKEDFNQIMAHVVPYLENKEVSNFNIFLDEESLTTLLEIYINVAPNEAALMSWDLVEKMVGYNLDGCNLLVGFVGTKV